MAAVPTVGSLPRESRETLARTDETVCALLFMETVINWKATTDEGDGDKKRQRHKPWTRDRKKSVTSAKVVDLES